MTLTKFLNWTIKLACFGPWIYWFAGAFLGWLGAEPLVKINTQSGYVVLILLLINLLIGAIHALGWLKIEYYRFLHMSRRWLGVACGIYTLMHFLTYLAKESFLPKGYEQIFTKNYLLAGIIAASLVWILTLTSNNISTRLLKKNWKRLHRLVYVAGIAVLFHIFQIEKANLVLLAILVLPVLAVQVVRMIKHLTRNSRAE